MPVAANTEFVAVVRECRLLDEACLNEVERVLARKFPEPRELARELARRGWLSQYQCNELLLGRGRLLLLGSYVLLDKLGEGGMGAVFKARNWKLGRTVALKLIRPEKLANAQAVKRFQREIRAAAQLEHANIVHAIDADEIAGAHLLVMEYVDNGIDLARLVKQRGPLPAALACDYIRQAALGLHHAHARGLVHRDIKPQNMLMVTSAAVAGGKPATTHQIKLLDMGLARLGGAAAPEDLSSTLTQDGAVVGTPDYIAPEQARDAHSADIRSDLYSLGCTLYFLLAGHAPFAGGTAMEKLIKHQIEAPPPLDGRRQDLPDGVLAIVNRLLAKKPEDRFQTPAELIQALDRVLPGLPAAVGLASVPVAKPLSRPGAPPEQAVTTAESWAGVTPASSETEALIRRLPPTPTAPLKPRKWLWTGVSLAALMLMLLIWRPWRTGKKSGPSPPSGKAKPAPAEDFTNSIGMKLRLIPAGKFLMGTPDGEPMRKPHEGPQHEVAISRPFYMGIHEVTQDQYQSVMGKNPSFVKKGQTRRPNLPVEQVTWHNATVFCANLSDFAREKSAGRVYRLPTEAEWEYACRAGTTTAYSFGDDLDRLDDFAWHSGNSGGRNHQVGAKKANAWGLFDMHGNVWEWCADVYQHDYYRKSPASDPKGPATRGRHVMRGGSNWAQEAERGRLRSGERHHEWEHFRQWNTGFRVVCDLPTP